MKIQMHAKLPVPVSVVMAVHGIALEWLEQAIESIIQQTFSNFEFIIVSDAPNDAKLNEALSTYAKNDPRISVSYNTEVEGFSRSINKAIALANGQYIVRMDADDISLPDRIERQLAYMRQNPHIGISGMQAEVIDGQGRIIGHIRKPCNPEKVTDYLFHVSPLIHPTYIVRCDVYTRLCGYRDFSPGQDHELLIRAYRMGIVMANQPYVGLKYRRSDISLSNQSIKRMMKAAQVMRLLMQNQSLDFPVLHGLMQCRESRLLRALYHTRNKLIELSRHNSPRIRPVFVIASILVSVMHPDLLRNSYHGFKASKIVKCEQNR